MNRKDRRRAQSHSTYKASIQIGDKTYSVEEADALAAQQQNVRRYDLAVQIYDLILAKVPNIADVHSNKAVALQRLRRYEDALASCDKAIALDQSNASAHYNRGLVLQEMRRLEESLVSFERAGALRHDIPFLASFLLQPRLHNCRWDGIDGIVTTAAKDIEAGKPVVTPFEAVILPLSRRQQRQCAETFVKNRFPVSSSPLWRNERYSHDKIRLGYFSADFQNHATSYLMAHLFELHDRSQFETFAFSFGPATEDPMRGRLVKAFDQFIDVSTKSDQEIATLARNMEIDIAVDLKGFTTNSRPGIFALRPAPVQVNYLGFPGTMGASYIDYLIADRVIIPEAEVGDYSEKIAYLPNTYQVNDSTRIISERSFTRQELGLPENGFVFCTFNHNYKITPSMFDIWMRLLKAVPGSVLWLYVSNREAVRNLLVEALVRGIARERLVFAGHMDIAEHLARHRLADLFLDTLPCNAHTTASDSLWAGLPIVTCTGETFAGRVASSLLDAIDLPELVTHSLEAYESLALELAADPDKLAAIRKKLVRNRATCPLFDTAGFTKHIEAAYVQMWKAHQAGMAPVNIYVGSSAA